MPVTDPAGHAAGGPDKGQAAAGPERGQDEKSQAQTVLGVAGMAEADKAEHGEVRLDGQKL